MKKVVCLLLSVLLIFVMSVSIFAENKNTEINDEQTPGAGLTVESLTYDEPDTIIIENEEIPEGTISPGVVEINEQEIPLAPALPDTGGIPAEAFYVAGALIVVAALTLLVKKDKAGQKE